jgi:hypothetical protein
MKRVLLLLMILLVPLVLADVGDVEVRDPVDRGNNEDSSSNSIDYIIYLLIGVFALGISAVFIYKFRTKKGSVLRSGARKGSVNSVKGSSESIHDEISRLREDLDEQKPMVLKKEVKNVLLMTDGLLGELSPARVKGFVESKDFNVYKRVMKKVYEPVAADDDKKKMIERVVMLLERKVIDVKEARKLLNLHERSIEPKKIIRKRKGLVLNELRGQRDEN